MKLTSIFEEFFNSEKAGGFILVAATALSLVLANSFLQTDFLKLWQFRLGGHSLAHWINDGLMTIFFLLIGLELEREIYRGELSEIRSAALPVFSALGGMLVPAGLYLLMNFGSETQAGAGIPMATDIAFAIGILSLLGSRAPSTLKIFLTALAVIDDLGAILVIAIFYTSSIAIGHLITALGLFGVLILLNRLRVMNLIPYIIGGIAMWYFMLHSGVHATITGVLLAFAIPFGGGNEKSPSYRLQHFLHKPVAFIILPIFAMANTSIILEANWMHHLGQMNSLGIISGLVIGKPLGVIIFSYLGVRLRLCHLPGDIKWEHIVGAGFLAGIGFTMSIFITLLAFDSHEIISASKIAVLTASCIAGSIGYLILSMTLPNPEKPSNK